MNTRAGYVTIIGLPNAGKSTLMNALLGERLSIITHKPQTTRKRVLGILSEENYQAIFLDTPGLLEPDYELQSRMMDEVNLSVEDADLYLLMIDLKNDPTGEKVFKNEIVQNILTRKNRKKVLILNKIDQVSEDVLQETALKIKAEGTFDRILGISALMKFNIEAVKEAIVEYLPEHPKYYPEDQLSDANERFFCSEIVREKILELYKEEIPYSVEVAVDEFKERSKGKDYILASIFVERDSQKAIIIGKQGEMIKTLGQKAREAIDGFLGRPVFLELRVKVKANWREDKKQLEKFGYSKGKDE